MIRDGVSGGYVTQTEYLITKYASESKLNKRNGNKLIAMATRADFDPSEIRTDNIRGCSCKRSERNTRIRSFACIRWTSGNDPVFEEPYCDCRGLGG